jgi:hypothetical protein
MQLVHEFRVLLLMGRKLVFPMQTAVVAVQMRGLVWMDALRVQP